MILEFIILFLICLIFFIAYKLYQFSLFILKIENSIENCLDILNERYASIGKILKKEIFFDSVEVRQVLADIRESQDAIVRVANELTNNVKMESIDEIEEKNKED